MKSHSKITNRQYQLR